MASFQKFDSSKQPRAKIELHVHLDGSVRITTIWDLMKKKGVDLHVKTLEELCQICSVKEPSTLANFLKPFGIFSPLIVGDAEAIERVAYEFCEDSANQGVIYCEPRYCPHLYSQTHSCYEGVEATAAPLSPKDVVDCVISGFSRAEKDFNIKVRSILCCYRARPEWSEEMLNLCLEYRDKGVVGIDIAGDEALRLASPQDVLVFQRAASLGIHRTVHAGEAGPASNVSKALNDMLAERVGHGYHVIDDPAIYSEAIAAGLHFETCPYSSLYTGSVDAQSYHKHPVVKFAEDGVNFSISRDDPTVIQKTLDDDYDLLRSFGLKDVHFARANFNAARSCFLPADEKEALLKQLETTYGVCGDVSSRQPIAEQGSGEK